MPLPLEELTRRILEAAFEVSNELGIGFLESVYEGALFLALKAKGLEVERQVPIQVRFRGEAVGQFYADLVVAGKVIVELKAVKALAPEHNAQVLNYLKATGNPVALLLNFGTSKLEFRRFEPRFGKNEQNRDEGDERDSSP
jgi:GxxExxY protein